MVNLVSTVIHTLFPHVREISHGKTIHFPSMYPHHLHWYVRVVIGLRFVLQAHPIPMPDDVRVPRVGTLPPASFRFHLTMDTLALG